MLYGIVFLTGIIFAAYGITGLVKAYRSSRPFVQLYPLDDGIQFAELNQGGVYSISFVGAGTVKPGAAFTVTVHLHQNGSVCIVKVKPRSVKYRFLFQGTVAVEYYEFNIAAPATAEIHIANTDSIIVKQSMLWSKQLIQPPLHKSAIKVLVRKSAGSLTLAIYIFIFALGLVLAHVGGILFITG